MNRGFMEAIFVEALKLKIISAKYHIFISLVINARFKTHYKIEQVRKTTEKCDNTPKAEVK